MLGAIIGDIIGSIYEFDPIKTKDFPLFGKNNEITDDSYLTMAVFSALEKCHGDYTHLSEVVTKELIEWYANYPTPMGGYGQRFEDWAISSLQNYKVLPPYNSFGNGAAMRISPVAYFANSIDECIELSKKVTQVTHNHPEGIKGAEAVAVTIYMALHGSNRKEITDFIKAHYYPLKANCNEIRKHYCFEASCQETVPQSIQAFLDSTCYEDAVRMTISLGGDADTMGAITGVIAEAYYGIPKDIESKIDVYLDDRCKKLVKRMIDKRQQVVRRYLEQDTKQQGFTHSRVNGIDMDGFPDNHQTNAAFKYNGVLYQSKQAKQFVKIDEFNVETPMNADDFQFFIDELRLHLNIKFKGSITSVEDFYNEVLIIMSNQFWCE